MTCTRCLLHSFSLRVFLSLALLGEFFEMLRECVNPSPAFVCRLFSRLTMTIDNVFDDVFDDDDDDDVVDASVDDEPMGLYLGSLEVRTEHEFM